MVIDISTRMRTCSGTTQDTASRLLKPAASQTLMQHTHSTRKAQPMRASRRVTAFPASILRQSSRRSMLISWPTPPIRSEFS